MFEQSMISGRQNIKKKNNGTHIGSDLPYYALMIIPNLLIFVSGMLLLLIGAGYVANRVDNWLDENYGYKNVEPYKNIEPPAEQAPAPPKKKLLIYNWSEGKPF